MGEEDGTGIMGSDPTEYLVGTSGWSYDGWKGPFYPSDLAKGKFFGYYAERFPTVEVNATFYRRFQDKTYRNWKDKAPEGFVYVFKVPRLISHLKKLNDCKELLSDFLRQTALLEEKLGMLLLQLPPSLGKDLDRLGTAIDCMQDPSKLAVEFRHQSWFCDQTREFLSEKGAAFCDVDSPEENLRGWLTSKSGYVRLHGKDEWYDHDYTDEELSQVTDVARDMSSRGAEKVFIFFNNDVACNAPRNALTLRDVLKGIKGT
jgi:uncharacterized protein YecE (DUF72 family)